jgi:hypothetical protein
MKRGRLTKYNKNYILVQENKECAAETQELTNRYQDILGCSYACEETESCRFFNWDSHLNKCFWSKTSSIDCPENFDENKGHFFYAILEPIESNDDVFT